MAQLRFLPDEVLASSATIPIGLVGTEILAENAPEFQVFGVVLFGGSVVDETLGRLFIGLAAIAVFGALDMADIIPPTEASLFTPRGLIEGAFWGLALGSVASAFMELYTFFGGGFTFDESEVRYGDLSDADSLRVEEVIG